MILRWLGSLGARLTIFIILALIAAQVAAVLIFVPLNERQRSEQMTENFLRNVSATVNLFNATPEINKSAYLRSIRQPGLNYWVAPTPMGVREGIVPTADWPKIPPEWESIQSPDKRLMWYPDARSLITKYRVAQVPSIRRTPGGDRPVPEGGGYDQRDERFFLPGDLGEARPPAPLQSPDGDSGLGRPLPPREVMGLPPLGGPMRPENQATPMPGTEQMAPPPGGFPSLRWRAAVLLDDGEWLVAEHMYELGLPPWMRTVFFQNAVIMGFMVLFVVPAVAFATKRLTVLAQHADKVGRGEDTQPIPEKGTSEIRRLIHAFNNMSHRLRRFVAGRTQMLAGISHDLRTPITALRLRADLVDDDENRERMLALIDDMHHITEATLTLARDDSFTEKSDVVDISSLIEGICDDLTDAGIDATAQVERGVKLTCRPHSLRRAIRNLAENGAKYGQRSRIHMNGDARNVRIIIDDDGPGIPDDQIERAFQPFVRLEESRNRQTGGTGLGLAITKSIILNHGGDITLANRPEGGLRATITLPLAEGDA